MAVTHAPATGLNSGRGWRLPAIRAFVDGYGAVLFIVGVYAAEQIALVNRLITPDGWLAILAGRDIDKLGLPHVDRWTVTAHGRAWVDQQWLAQLALYRIQALGGLRLVVIVGLLLAVGSLVAALMLALRRGAASRPLAGVVLVSLIPYGRSADNLRTQSLCYPLFVALLWLLTRPRTRSIYLVFPTLIVWANLHGSAILAALLVSGCALLRARESSWPRLTAFVVGPWLCLFASPYALQLPHYYRTLLVNPSFGRYVVEWKPLTLTLLDSPTFVILAAVLILFGTGRTGWRREEGFILCVCSLLTLLAVRNAVWLALAAIVLVGPAASTFVPPFKDAAAARRMNRLLVSLAGTAVIAATIATATRPADWYTAEFPANVANVAATAAGAHGRVFTTETFGDWLLWQHQELAGRVSVDARLELLRASELRSVFELEDAHTPQQALVHGYRVFVVPPDLVSAVRTASPVRLRVLERSRDVVVLAAL